MKRLTYILMLLLYHLSSTAQFNATYSYNSNNYYGYSMDTTLEGGYIIAGSLNNNGKDIVVIKTDNEGDTLFKYTYSTGYDEEAYCVRTCLDSGYILCGYNDGAQAVRQMPDLSYILGGYKSNSTNRHGWIVKIGEWGDTVSTYTYATDYNEQFNDVTVTDSIYVAGAGTKNTLPTSMLVVQWAYSFTHYYPRYIWVNNIYNVATVL